MKWRLRINEIITALVVIVLLLNIETIELALFINAVGIDVFLLLLEVQLIAIGIASFNYTVKPVIKFFLGFSIHPFFIPTWRDIKAYPGSLVFALPPGAIIMSLLFSSAAVYVVYRVAV